MGSNEPCEHDAGFGEHRDRTTQDDRQVAVTLHEIRRTGENETRKIDVRVIAATNRNLEREVNRSRFREDLYFRLSVVTVHLPPLRERPEDIPLLVRTFLERLGAAESEPLFTPEVFRDLAEHEWPGNVRELRNYVERSISIGISGEPAPAEPTVPVHLPLKDARAAWTEQFETRYVEALLAKVGGNVTRAAQLAGINRRSMQRLIASLGLREPPG